MNAGKVRGAPPLTPAEVFETLAGTQPWTPDPLLGGDGPDQESRHIVLNGEHWYVLIRRGDAA